MLAADEPRCEGRRSPVNPSRTLGICRDCARREPPTAQSGRIEPPAKHDGQRWHCSARIERERAEG
jgi:hypothetical protein